ncbi:MAG: hypothetical protein GWN84_14470 [Gammaproteobacteria bacterium]|nr:hypothetical protein [Gammaproteobacteria bacterium]NIR84004.1 hypothetical protein [Gammaproteobacteria bacterium]NIR89148.1 hypothetical protein [Gammaproteobacteria bacterium]NIU04950.1 hypothetical protein [Gammaproteobacteria bacterium]NIV52116.1 hypothetical protein [Gammaproteobacteria bacterium]
MIQINDDNRVAPTRTGFAFRPPDRAIPTEAIERLMPTMGAAAPVLLNRL